jgi:hypothetical protein
VAGRSSSDLCISSERWESSSNRFREVNGDEALGWDVSGVKWGHCHVCWGGGLGPVLRGPCDGWERNRACTTMRRLGRRRGAGIASGSVAVRASDGN